ncbi:hypothetical protein G6L05_02840 [Agrobacterium rhizogenes]|nr:hypothetical protein [Rhizobium rhizogenes]
MARGTGAGTTELENFSGLLVNKNAITIRYGSASGNTLSIAARCATYLGSFRATADGQATDTQAARLLFNAYNLASRRLFVGGAAATYTYSTATWRDIGGVGLKIELLLGLSGTLIEAAATSLFANSTSTAQIVRSGIGVDSTTAPDGGSLIGSHAATPQLSQMIANYSGYPGLGYHYLSQLEMGAGADTQTWFAYSVGLYRAGMIGSALL